MSAATESGNAPAVRVRGLSKRFGETEALSKVSLDLTAGRVHAVVGLNGSGKSTLVKLLSGFYKADEGEVLVGELAFVHQDLGLLQSMTVLENFAIGPVMPTRRWQIDWQGVTARATEALRPFELEHLITRQISTLTQAEQTVVAIARALDRSQSKAVSAILLDEPTSALPTHETALLTSAIRSCASRGLAVLFITHRLQEVLDIADDVTVLRNGRAVFTGPTRGLSIGDLVSEMVGEATTRVPDAHDRASFAGAAPVLAAHSVWTATLRGVTVEVSPGEILGIFGMSGSGVESIGEVLAGRVLPQRGTVLLNGRPLASRKNHFQKIGYVPSDRPHKGILPGLNVRENVSLCSLPATLRGWSISRRREGALADQEIENLKIKPPERNAPILSLSGGNQQKAVLGRWLAVRPPVIVADEPTQGVDVWAKMEILQQFRVAAQSGTAVVLTAVEPEEVLDFCDRVIVLRRGTVQIDVPRGELSTTDILNAVH